MGAMMIEANELEIGAGAPIGLGLCCLMACCRLSWPEVGENAPIDVVESANKSRVATLRVWRTQSVGATLKLCTMLFQSALKFEQRIEGPV